MGIHIQKVVYESIIFVLFTGGTGYGGIHPQAERNRYMCAQDAMHDDSVDLKPLSFPGLRVRAGPQLE